MRQTAEQWASEGLEKYGAGAIAWIGRWKVNLQDYPDDLAMLDRAIEILEAPVLGAAGGCQRALTTKQRLPAQPFLPMPDPPIWIEVKDGNATGRSLFRQHYSYRPYADGRDPALFVGPGEKLMLLTPDARALFVWRKFKSGDNQHGVNCAVFRNDGAGLASDLIRAADAIAWERWPQERHYTYVNSKKIRSSNPGYCFIKAGWNRLPYVTKNRKLAILEIESPEIQNCRSHQLACLEYLQDPTKDSELTRNYGSQDERGAIQGLEDWFAQELLLTYPEIFNK